MLVLLGAILSTPHPASPQPIRDLLVAGWETEDGLPQNSVIAMARDGTGYLWLATFDGVVRFDGLRFQVYRTANTPELPVNRVFDLTAGGDGAIWLAAGDAGVVEIREGRFRHTSMEALGMNDEPRALRVDEVGTIWIVTERAELWRWTGSGKAIRVTPEAASLATHPPDPGPELWLVGPGSLFHIRSGVARNYDPVELGHGVTNVLDVHRDPTGTLWLGLSSGAVVYRNGEVSSIYPYREGSPTAVWTILGDGEGGALLGTRLGLMQWRNGEISPVSMEQGVGRVWIRALLQDGEGNLWVGTDGAGLRRLRPARFRRISVEEGLSDPLVLSLFQAENGDLWVGTNCGGVNRISPDGIQMVALGPGAAGQCTWSVHGDPDGTFWFGTWGDYLLRYRDGVVEEYGPDRGITDPRVMVLHRDRGGVLWVGTMNGLFREVGERFEEVGVPGMENPHVMTVLEDSDGTLHFGTDRGIVSLSSEGIRTVGASEGIRAPVRALHRDPEGRLWVGSWGDGLFRIDAHGVRRIGVREGLGEDAISHILEDDVGFFWMGSNRGVIRVHREALNRALDRGERPFVRVFTVRDGLPAVETNGGFYPSAIRARDGTFWFPTIRGLAGVHPTELNLDTRPPPVVIERVIIGGEEVSPDDRVTIPAGAINIEIHFTALTLKVPEETRFRYRMEGLDREWVEADTRRVAYFTALPPGEYRFQVVAANPDGVWNSQGASLALVQRPAWHEHVATRLLFLTALILVTLWFVRRRMDTHIIRERELEDEIQDRTEELWERKEALERANVDLARVVADLAEQRHALEEARLAAESASRAKSAFLATMSHELRTPLNSVIGFANILRRKGAPELGPEAVGYLERISRNGEHLLHLINEILDLSKVEAGKVELEWAEVELGPFLRETVAELEGRAMGSAVELRVEVPEGLHPLRTDHRRLKQILINLVGNALKFTSRGEVVVRAVPDDEGERAVAIEVVDTGVGIPVERLPWIFEPFEQGDAGTARRFGGTGLGLALSRALAELLGYRLGVESVDGVGSTFRITLTAPDASSGSSLRP